MAPDLPAGSAPEVDPPPVKGPRPAVGDELPVTTVAITRDLIARYADVSGDHNPIHLDDEFARRMGLPGVIAHGMLGMGLLAHALSVWLGDHRRLRRLRVRFSGLVEPGDRLSLGARVTALQHDGTVSLEVWADNQRGERVLSKGQAVVFHGHLPEANPVD